jgi:hypothetical protein
MGIFKRGSKDTPADGTPATPEVPESQTADGAAWAGRGLRLQHPVTLENVPVFAQQAATAIGNIEGVTITYAVSDLEVVDRAAGNMHHAGVGSDAVAETLWVFGCLVGEIMVRNAGGTWKAFSPEEQQAFGFPFGIALPNGQVCNPIGKTFKRVDNGEEDSLPYFYRVFTQD